MTWLAYDVFSMLLLALLVTDCARKGFLRKIIGFIGAVAAGIGAGLCSTPAALWLYENIVRDTLRLFISERASQAVAQGLDGALPDLSFALPAWAARLLPEGAALPDAPARALDVGPIVEGFIDSALAQPVLLLLRGVCFFGLFALFLALARMLARVMGLANRLPVVGPVNTMLGGVLGVGEGLLILWLLAAGARLYITWSGGGGEYVNESIITDGYLFSFFYRISGS